MNLTLLLKRVYRKRHKLEDVFTPSTSAKLTFVDRDDLEKQLTKALMIPGMQIIVYGHSGSGKTTITQNILAKRNTNYIVTNCILDTSIDEIILDAFDKFFV